MDGLGISPLGDGLGPWGGPGLITIKGVVPVGRRTAAIVLDRIPKLDDDGAWNDASDITNYSIFPIDPTQLTEQNEPFIPPGKVKATHEVAIVDTDLYEPDPLQLLVTTDCTMEPGVDYEITLLYIKGAAGEQYAGPTTWTFKALSPSKKFPIKYVLAQAQDQLGLKLQAVQTLIEKRATFACTPGLKRPPLQVAPGLLACGDYVAGPYPATLEGAVRAGQAAGQAVTQTSAP